MSFFFLIFFPGKFFKNFFLGTLGRQGNPNILYHLKVNPLFVIIKLLGLLVIGLQYFITKYNSFFSQIQNVLSPKFCVVNHRMKGFNQSINQSNHFQIKQSKT